MAAAGAVEGAAAQAGLRFRIFAPTTSPNMCVSNSGAPDQGFTEERTPEAAAPPSVLANVGFADLLTEYIEVEAGALEEQVGKTAAQAGS